MKFADFVRPKSLEEARSVLKEKGDKAMPVAGATSFQYFSDREGVTAVDISRLDFGGIERKGDTFTIGANTTLHDLVRFEDKGWVLNQVATLIPTHQIRNISTIGGNISRLFPWSETPLALIVLDGKITVQGDSEEVVGASDFFARQPRNILKDGRLVTSVEVPAVKAGQGFGYKKESVTNAAFALMTAAAFIEVDGGNIKEVRVSAGSALPVPTRITAVEEALKGKPADTASFGPAVEAGTPDYPWTGNEGQTDEYAAHLAKVIIQDALESALTNATGAA